MFPLAATRNALGPWDGKMATGRSTPAGRAWLVSGTPKTVHRPRLVFGTPSRLVQNWDPMHKDVGRVPTLLPVQRVTSPFSRIPSTVFILQSFLEPSKSVSIWTVSIWTMLRSIPCEVDNTKVYIYNTFVNWGVRCCFRCRRWLWLFLSRDGQGPECVYCICMLYMYIDAI